MPPSNVFGAPFSLSRREGVDPALVPFGEFVSAQNARMSQQGAITKRRGSTPVAVNAATSDANSDAPTIGFPNALFTERGARSLIAHCKAFIETPTVGKWLNKGNVSRVTPRRIDTVWDQETASSASIGGGMQHPSCVYSNGWVIHAIDDSVLTISLIFSRADGAKQPVSQYMRNYNFGGTRPRLVPVGATTVIVAFQTNGANSISVCTIDTSTDLPTVSNPTVVAATVGVSAFDAAPYSSTQWLLVVQSAVGFPSNLTLRRLTGTTINDTLVRQIDDGLNSSAVYSLAVCGTPGEKIFVAWMETYDLGGGSQENKTRGWCVDSTAFTTSSGPTLVSPASPKSGSFAPVAVCRYDATHCLIFWSGIDTDPASAVAGENPYKTYWCTNTMSSAGALGSATPGRFFNMRLSSKPFLADGEIYIWTNTDNVSPDMALPSFFEGGWDVQRTYQLFRCTKDGTWVGALGNAPLKYQPFFEMHAAPIQAASASIGNTVGTVPDVTHLGDCVFTGGDWLFGCLNVTRAHTGVDPKELKELVAVRFYEQSQGLSKAWRHVVDVNGIPHCAGGYLAEFIDNVWENNFVFAPVLLGIDLIAGGVTDNGQHAYTVVYEYIDSLGRRHRSAPAEPAIIVCGGGLNKPRIQYSTCNVGKAYQPDISASGNFRGPVAHIYRTKVGESVYHRVTPNTGFLPAGGPGLIPISFATHGFTTYDDSITDASIDTEILYTDGGVEANSPARSCRFMAYGGSRLFLGGLLESHRVQSSKIIVSSEPVQFVESDTFFIDLPEDVTALAWGDGALIVFCENSIWLVSGDGPDDRGQGVFADPRKLPSDVGCIDPRSVIETADGWFFQSHRGIYMVPRGFGPPIFIGADVQTSLSTAPLVCGAVNVIQEGNSLFTPEANVRMLVSDDDSFPTVSYTMVFDTLLRRWISNDIYTHDPLGAASSACGIIGTWSGGFVVTRPTMDLSSPLVAESSSAIGDNAVFFPLVLTTGELRPFGYLGFGQVFELQLFYQDAGAAEPVAVALIQDGESQSISWGGNNLVGDGKRKYHSIALTNQNCNSLQLSLSDVSAGASSKGAIWLGLALQINPLLGLKRLGDSDRS